MGVIPRASTSPVWKMNRSRIVFGSSLLEMGGEAEGRVEVDEPGTGMQVQDIPFTAFADEKIHQLSVDSPPAPRYSERT